MMEQFDAEFREIKEGIVAVREAHDKREKEIVNKIDDRLDALEDRVNKRMESLAHQEHVDEVARTVARLEQGGALRGEDRDRFEASARQFFRTPGLVNQIGGEFGQDHLEAYGNFGKAWLKLVRANGRAQTLSADVQNNLRVGLDTEGGYFVPTEMESTMRKRVFDTSPVRSIAGSITIGTEALEFPTDPNDATSGGWVGEMETRSETATPNVGMQKIEVHEQYAMPKASQKILDDGAIDIQGWLTDKTVDKMIRTENLAFVSGNGVVKPRGFLDYSSTAVTTAEPTRAWGLLQYQPSGLAGGFPAYSGTAADDPSALLDLMAELNDAYHSNARWVMNRRTRNVIRKLRDADGHYLVEFGRGIEGNATSWLLHGYPITILEDMPSVDSNTYSVAFGDFSQGYLVVDRMGVRTIVDNLTTKGQVKFYFTKRVGGDVVNFDAIKLMKFAAS